MIIVTFALSRTGVQKRVRISIPDLYEMIYHKLKVLNDKLSVDSLIFGKVSSKFTLPPIIMGSVENHPK